MDFDEDTLKKYAKKSSIETTLQEHFHPSTVESNIDALNKDAFPKKLLEKFKEPEIKVQEHILKEIEERHVKILANRPLPELLENVNLVSPPDDLQKPKMGSLYKQKKELKD